jgi:hypothetical protein
MFRRISRLPEAARSLIIPIRIVAGPLRDFFAAKYYVRA